MPSFKPAVQFYYVVFSQLQDSNWAWALHDEQKPRELSWGMVVLIDSLHCRHCVAYCQHCGRFSRNSKTAVRLSSQGIEAPCQLCVSSTGRNLRLNGPLRHWISLILDLALQSWIKWNVLFEGLFSQSSFGAVSYFFEAAWIISMKFLLATSDLRMSSKRRIVIPL